jgi:hypothetical protein
MSDVGQNRILSPKSCVLYPVLGRFLHRNKSTMLPYFYPDKQPDKSYSLEEVVPWRDPNTENIS